MNMARILPIALIAVLLVLIADGVEAQNTARIDQVSESFKGAVQSMGSKLSAIARNLMLSLLLIELIWKLGKTVMEGDDFGKLMGVFFKRILIAGFFLAIVDGIPTGSGQVGFGSFVIQSAEALTNHSLGTVSIKPSDLFWEMFSSGQSIYSNSTGVTGSIAAVIVWLLLVMLGAVIVGLMIVAYIEIYVIFTVGILALGFGVWSVTDQFAKNFMFSAIGKTLKLFTMILMGSIIALQIKAFGSLSGFEDGLVTIGVVLIFALLMTTVPAAVEQIVSGMSSGGAEQTVQSAVTGASMGAAQRGMSMATKGGKAGLGSAAGGLGKMGINKAGAIGTVSGIANRIRSIKRG